MEKKGAEDDAGHRSGQQLTDQPIIRKAPVAGQSEGVADEQQRPEGLGAGATGQAEQRRDQRAQPALGEDDQQADHGEEQREPGRGRDHIQGGRSSGIVRSTMGLRNSTLLTIPSRALISGSSCSMLSTPS